MGNSSKHKTAMNGMALVIGIDKYDEVDTITQLDKAVADAKAIAAKFKELGFDVLERYDITSHEYDEIKAQFIDNLRNSKVGIFFFAGHGLECNGQNILLTRNTIASTGFPDTLKRYSIILQDLVNDMHNVCDANVIIIDACRQTYVEKIRGSSTSVVAPMFAPKGTMIAFSTSSGETAGEGKKDSPHSNYTTALLQHLDEPNLEVERLFKKVRTTLHTLTQGKQTSWEHTSLIGNFIFNTRTPIEPEIDHVYSNDAIADKNWYDPIISSIIDKFKSHSWYSQNDAIDELKRLKNLSKDQLFIVGRNILQSYIGGSHNCDSFIHSIQSIMDYTEKNGDNHLLNGILYEIYFDSNGQFRGPSLKNDYLNWMVTLIKCGRFSKSFDFIRGLLTPFENRLLFVPSNRIKTLEIEVIGKNSNDGIFGNYNISDITIDGISLLTDDFADTHPSVAFYDKDSVEGLQNVISRTYAIPKNLIKITFIEEPNDDVSINIEKKFRII